MNNLSLNNLFYNMGLSMGLTKSNDNTHDCGTFMRGDNEFSDGFMWYYAHENLFVITSCDVLFTKNFNAKFSPSERYITLRLDTAEHITPGKIVSFIEEKYDAVKTTIKAGTRIRYVDITYFPAFYEKHLSDSFKLDGVNDSPTNILKNLGGDHNWPTTMINILSDIKASEFKGASGAMFYTAKAYELMSELINMGHSRLPAKSEDYRHIVSVLQHIGNSLKGEIKQGELVKIGGMSSTKLKNVFKQFTGKTITDYILHKRADIASHLLLETDKSIEEVAAEVGFKTATGFATSFKKTVGVSPSEYRKKMLVECMQNPSQSSNLNFGVTV